MFTLPASLLILFGLTAILTVYLLFKAGNYSKFLVVVVISWVITQSILAFTGFYQVTEVMPPRLLLLVLPPVFLIISLFLTPKGRLFLDKLDYSKLLILHTVRIPVEICLFWLYLYGNVPALMTFEGNNFDIFSGISAPVLYYFTYIKKKPGKTVLIIWNIICLILLLNIVITAMLSAPFPIQKFGFEQPNTAILHFPFSLLPGLIVPCVLFAHLASLRKLFLSRSHRQHEKHTADMNYYS